MLSSKQRNLWKLCGLFLVNKVSVLFCFDERILLGAGVSIVTLVDCAAESTVLDIRIMHPGLSDEAKGGLLHLIDGSRHEMKFVEVSPDRFSNAPKNRGSWTEIVYYRLVASEILSDCDRVIYSDVDVFFKRDLYSAFSMNFDGAEWAGVAAERNEPNMLAHKYFPENTKERVYFSGFMVMNLELMRENRAVERYFEGIEWLGHRLKFFDLDLVNVLTQKIAQLPFDYVVLEDIYEVENIEESREFGFLNSVYSVQDLEAARQDPAIIHYAGPRGKPWQRQQVPRYYQEVVDRLPAELQRTTFRDWRKTWLSSKGRKRRYQRSDGLT